MTQPTLLDATDPTRRWARLSECQRYRYVLGRRWGDGPTAAFIMLNPSTADADTDDPTIRRCVGFARREGCGTLLVVNLFAWRATDPGALREVADPVGPENDDALQALRVCHGPVIAAWGADTMAAPRAAAVLPLLPARLMCLGTTKAGAPRHPLYVPADAPLVSFRQAAEVHPC